MNSHSTNQYDDHCDRVSETTPGKNILEGSEECFYFRQKSLQEISTEGQDRLRAAKIAVVGAGALGCASLPYLAGAGIGEIDIFDDDCVDLSNLHRQTLYRYDDLGLNKAQLAARELTQRNPFIKVKAITSKVFASNISLLLQDYSIVVDGTDNLATKLLLSDFCFYHRIPLVTAGIFRFSSQLHVFADFGKGCFRCFWPHGEQDALSGGNCAQAGILGSVAAVTGSIQAHEVLKIILDLPRLNDDVFLLMDLLQGTFKKIKKKKNDDCLLCSNIRAPFLGSHKPGEPKKVIPEKLPHVNINQNFDIDIRQLKHIRNCVIIDIRDDELNVAPKDLDLPLKLIPHWDTQAFAKLPNEKTYVLACHTGNRSKLLARELTVKFPEKKFLSLDIGIHEVFAALSNS